MTYFIFCIHNHQPVGNFEEVIEDAFQKAYMPFLEKLFERPTIKFSLHTTGFLLEWLERVHPEYIEKMRAMVRRGQLEVMGGGYYEPVLAVIPAEDRAGQIRLMADNIERLFGARPRGIWLAERVWDPTLPADLHAAGVEYLVVDDYHFIKSGLRRDGLFGYYVTEELGKPVKVFPGSERLRYLIPFEEAGKFEEYMRGLEAGGQRRAAIFADDGEKFGVWPGTNKWVYDDGWIDSFLDKLEESSEWIKPVTFSEFIDAEEPLGRVYLPTTSYMEMGEWALPPEVSNDYTQLHEELKQRGAEGERILQYCQGGAWRNFFSKYPEADWMHKRMLLASMKLGRDAPAQALDHIYRAQANDAYWHGVFGGLYLPHLRFAVYEHILKAEAIVEETGRGSEVNIIVADINADTHEEVEVSGPELNLYISPRHGGSIFEIDFKPGAVNITNTLSRRYEGYHEKLKEAGAGAQDGGGAKSIHEAVVMKEEGLAERLAFDSVRRSSLRERFLPACADLDALAASRCGELGDFFDSEYSCEVRETGLTLTRDGLLSGRPFRVSKTLCFDKAGGFSAGYELTGEVDDSLKGVMMGVEFNICLPGCSGPACYLECDGSGVRHGLDRLGVDPGVESLVIVDEYSGVRVGFELNRPVTLWRYPVETVSLSEAGFERIYQGSSIVFLVPLEELTGLVDKFTITLKVESV
ncbi:Alpha-amylase [hydrothermal vent metagenome]|uniref:Alpha-amylase n=1 Tax=hydrothermal vent metagenome TaxID=652676 RepID=A0A3B0V3S3_9ZZZZ